MNDLYSLVIVVFAVITGALIGIAGCNAYWQRRFKAMNTAYARTIGKVSADCGLLFMRYFTIARLMKKPLDLSRERSDDEE